MAAILSKFTVLCLSSYIVVYFFKNEINLVLLNGSSLKLVDMFTFLGSSVSSTETDINTRLAKAWTATENLPVIWKSDLADKINHSFFQAAIQSILLYGSTTWTLNKRMEKKLDGNYTRMLRAILNKSCRQHIQSSSCTATCHPS